MAVELVQVLRSLCEASSVVVVVFEKDARLSGNGRVAEGEHCAVGVWAPQRFFEVKGSLREVERVL